MSKSRSSPLVSADAPETTAATKSLLPKDIRPQLATSAKSPPLGDEWLHEIKFDGYRILALKDAESLRLLSRNDKDWTRKFQSIAQALQSLPGKAVLDGEVVVLDEDGRCSFQALQRIVKGQKKGRLVYYAFDLLWADGHDLRNAPLMERKEELRRLLESLPENSIVRFSDYVLGNGDLFFQGICKLGVEGMVSKNAQSRYSAGRSRDWVKVKCPKQQDFVVGGFTAPEGSRLGFGSLLVGRYDDHGELYYAGAVGTGFDQYLLRELHPLLLELKIAGSPFANPPSGREILRHPIFKGLRGDVDAQHVQREEFDPR